MLMVCENSPIAQNDVLADKTTTTTTKPLNILIRSQL